MLRTNIIAILFLVCTFQISFSQTIDFEYLTLKDGLSQSSVYALMQDKQGFMWMGTQDGLNRYDGYEFKVYKKNPQSEASLSDNWVTSLVQDPNGFIWIGTRKGLNRFEPRTETFKQFLYQEKEANTLVNNEINTIFLDQSGLLWIGTNGGLSVLNTQTLQFKSFPNPPKSIFNNRVLSVEQDNKGQMWIGTQKGVVIWNIATNQAKHFTHQTQDKNSLSNDTVNVIFKDKVGLMWLGTNKGLNQVDARSYAFQNFQIEDGLGFPIINSLFEDANGKLWVGTYGGGVSILDKKMMRFSMIQQDELRNNSLSSNFVFSIFGDKNNVLWIGTYTAGICKYDSRQKKFQTFSRNPKDPTTLSDNNVRTILEDSKGRLWIGTYSGGLNLWDNEANRFIHFKRNPQDSTTLSSNDVQILFEDKQGVIWVGTKGGGLNKIVEQNGKIKFKAYRNNPNNPFSISNNNIRVLYEDSKGNFWIGTFGGGLNKMDREKGAFIHYKHQENNPKTIGSNIVYSMLEDSKGRLWVGTRETGISMYDYKTNTFSQHFRHADKDTTTVSHNNIMCIFEDTKKNIWIGTYGGALNLWNESKRIFIRYNEKDGLPNDVVYGILEDKKGNLWMSTNKGISKFNLAQKNFRNYDDLDGLQSNEFSGGAYHKGRSGKLYFGGVNGFNAFLPDKIQDNPYIPPILITDFQIFNESISIHQGTNPILKEHISFTRKIILNHRQSVFSFEFVALNFTRATKNQYMYRLRGFQKDKWNYTKDRRFVTYTNLDPGTYYFEVKASNNDGVWNETPTVIEIVILPPFWRTWWFRILAVLLGLGLIFWIYKRRINRMEKQRRKLEEEVEKQTAEIKKQKEELQATLEHLKTTQTQLLQADKMASLGQLTAGIAHEINNPINFVFAGINSLKTNLKDVSELIELYEEITPDNVSEQIKEIQEFREDIEFEEVWDEVNELTDSIKRGAERTAEIVKGLRTFSRLDEDDLKHADLHENLDATLTILHNQYKNRVEIIKHYETVPKIDCYPGKLNQVFMNIIANAIQAIEDKGTIEISTQSLDNQNKPNTHTTTDWVQVRIKDSGKGMPEHVRKRIFEPFFTTKDVGKGTGLGLSIVHSIIEKHNALIEVQSEEGKGTEFIITLPVSQKEFNK